MEEDVNIPSNPISVNNPVQEFNNIKASDEPEKANLVKIVNYSNTEKEGSQINTLIRISGWQVRKSLDSHNDPTALKRLNRKFLKKRYNKKSNIIKKYK